MNGARPVLEGGYQALKEGVGAYRLPRDVVWVHGPDAATYLQGQCSQDVLALAAGAAADSLLLAPDGKLEALVRLARLAPDGFLVDVDAGFADRVVARLLRFRLRAKVDVDRLAWSCLSLRGRGVEPAAGGAGEPTAQAGAGEPTDRAAGPGEPTDRAGGAGEPTVPGPLAVDWNGWSGVDLLAPDPGPPPGARWCTEAAWEACRVEAGVPVMGRELDERTIAAEAGLVDHTVSFTKGCFTGQELVARLDARGNRVARRLCGVVVPGDKAEVMAVAALVGGVLRPPGGGAEGPDRGRLTSAAWSPALGGPVALAYAHRSLEVPGPVDVVPAGSDRRWPAELRPLPLA